MSSTIVFVISMNPPSNLLTSDWCDLHRQKDNALIPFNDVFQENTMNLPDLGILGKYDNWCGANVTIKK